jgi:hypothetical protein
MTPVISWWLFALIVGGSAPLWVHAMAERWARKARERTERLLAGMEKQAPPHDSTSG